MSDANVASPEPSRILALDTPRRPRLPQASWPWVLCLVGLDYFSSLAYQPSIAVEAAGQAAPLATLVVVLFTLCGALPVYMYIAGRSPHGEGAVALLERSFLGWRGKLVVLVLLGFSATDFVMTRTLSTADAAVHLLSNPAVGWQSALARLVQLSEHAKGASRSPLWQHLVGYWNQQLVVTVLLSTLAFAFWAVFRRGFTRRLIQASVVVVTIYMTLTAWIVACGLFYLFQHPSRTHAWWHGLLHNQAQGTGGTWLQTFPILSMLGLCLLAFPQMSLGLSGFELSMVALPMVRGSADDDQICPRQRIRNSRKLLLAATFLMSFYLLGATFVTTLLIPAEVIEFGVARNRALTYLAHGGTIIDGHSAALICPWFGPVFGCIYDASTVIILCLAGASISIGLRDLVPEYLHRLGMALPWAHRVGVILHVFNLVNLAVTVFFRASVTAQRGAYATSVLTLISGAALAAAVDRWGRGPKGSRHFPIFFTAVAVLFLLYSLNAMAEQVGGILIASAFVVATLLFSVVSRFFRHMELRYIGFEFKDAHSKFIWDTLRFLEFPILVPHRPGHMTVKEKEEKIRLRHRLPPEVPVVFVEAVVGDASDFFQRPIIDAMEEEGHFFVRITRCVSIAHVLAAVGLELSRDSKPPEIHFGWSNESPTTANLNFLLFGQGNIPWMVRDLIRRAEPNPAKRPPVVIG